jgi:hypothetical protein
MKEERGDFKWKGEKIVWVPSEKGEWTIHPALGLMKADDPNRGTIIGRRLAEKIDIALRKVIKKFKNEK